MRCTTSFACFATWLHQRYQQPIFGAPTPRIGYGPDEARWFTQRLDHFGDNQRTFQQKFYMSTEHYRPGGPILLFQGEESTSLDCLGCTIMHDFAQKLNGIVVNLEHRYFGQSVPFGSNLTAYSSNQWKYLTLDNVLRDAVVFVQSVARNETANNSAPIFAASGSYGGFVVTLMRQNYPDTFRGVIASAPALRAFFGENDTYVPDQYSWWNYVTRTYRARSSSASDKIRNAFLTLKQRFSSNDIASLHHELSLCDPVLDNSTNTFSILAAMLQQVFSLATEFNYNIARPGRTARAHGLQYLNDIASRENDPLQILNRSNWDWYSASAASLGMNYTCLSLSNIEQTTTLAVPLISHIPFSYVCCTYLQIALFVDSGTLFIPQERPELMRSAQVQACKDKYGVTAPISQDFYEKYHFTDAEIRNSTGIIFSLAEYDPVTAISGAFSFEMPLRSHPHASVRIYTTDMAHREDLFPLGPYTRDSVRHTNMVQLEILKQWMKLE
ncbi:hypothetical protein AC578_10610 [Pseudocercospora eumusae]|uniref:Uncharacterized protein n=1 Tax=Pseudocercospora eumusae TaxID=321146 RepID=A0A139HKF7_9PEZI|nr:hypothetical protein AC578_10610 [Pseudocercospora eumusae]KXT02965.1 hypothetical protein AC578_10610 [Pseudocercospora eumusae]KXT02966.1 hypothetical protein AC578_10610 [Pseudocercospora eumusae]KXT02968.1 hypothetical protein AC578_10610 [Pseudocercospora eumusae]